MNNNNTEKAINDKIENLISNTPKEKYDEIAEDGSDIEKLLSLSELRSNIIKWYPFEKESNVLEIGSNYGEITEYLCQNVEKVTAIETSMDKSEIVKKRCSAYENIECIVGSLDEIQNEGKYEYILLIGQLEKATKWFRKSKNPEEDLIIWAKNRLKENGKIILATDNRFGIQNWNGKKNSDENYEFKNMIQERDKNLGKLFGKKSLERMLEKTKCKNYQTYFVFPDYRLANLIYSEDYQLTEEDISRNFKYYEDEQLVLFNENEMLKQIFEDNPTQVNFFANSFLIVIGNESLNNEGKYISFTNYRKEKYRVMTIIKDRSVIKKASNLKAMTHIKKIGENIRLLKEAKIEILENEKDNVIQSPYISEDRFDVFLNNSDEKLFIEFFKKYVNLLYSKSISFEEIHSKENLPELIRAYNIKELNKLRFLKNAFIDLIPKNCFLTDGKFVFFDQEWRETLFPVEYIIYRAINNSNLNNYRKNLIMNKYNIKVNENLFIKLEESFRTEIIDRNIYNNIFNKKTTNIAEIIATKNHFYNLKNAINVELTSCTNELNTYKEEVKKLKKELEAIYESRSWKFAKKIQKLKPNKK